MDGGRSPGETGTLREFSLRPFPGEPTGPVTAIAGAIGRRGRTLSVRYALRGDLAGLAIPAPAASPARKDRLWEDTCLEFFLAETGSPGYREFNLSPAGHWNVYRFDACRTGMREEPAFPSLPFRVRTEPGALLLSLELDLGAIVAAAAPLEAAVSAVVRTADGATGHWALAHPALRPDFHRRDAFALVLPPSP